MIRRFAFFASVLSVALASSAVAAFGCSSAASSEAGDGGESMSAASSSCTNDSTDAGHARERSARRRGLRRSVQLLQHVAVVPVDRDGRCGPTRNGAAHRVDQQGAPARRDRVSRRHDHHQEHPGHRADLRDGEARPRLQRFERRDRLGVLRPRSHRGRRNFVHRVARSRPRRSA